MKSSICRASRPRYELKEDAVSLPGIVDDCRHLLTLRAKKREVTIYEAIEDNMPRIWADERALRQIALNLLTNAIKFTPQGGSVTIKVGWTAAGGQYSRSRIPDRAFRPWNHRNLDQPCCIYRGSQLRLWRCPTQHRARTQPVAVRPRLSKRIPLS